MLVVQGLEDKVAVPQNTFQRRHQHPRTWLASIPNCGHNMIFEQPYEVAEQICGVLDEAWLFGCRRRDEVTVPDACDRGAEPL